MGELAAGIAHEIRNPLASISGSVQVLKGMGTPGSGEHRLMDIVVTESQRLSRILEDFLRYVRPRERAVEPVDAPAALRDVLTLLAAQRRGLAAAHDLLRSRSPLRRPPADPGQLRQIFWNVSRNALSAMPAGGSLAVRTRLEGGTWTVSFADDGRGMTAGGTQPSLHAVRSQLPRRDGARPRDRLPDRRGARRADRRRDRAAPRHDRHDLPAGGARPTSRPAREVA